MTAMTSDLDEHPRPYSLRIPPRPDEAWPGYLDRVAHAYACTPADVIAPLSRRWERRLTQRTSPTAEGVAMTPQTATAAARLLNLTPDAVQAMQLSAHDGTTLTFHADDPRHFDPVQGMATWRDVERLGWLRKRLSHRTCPDCDREGRPSNTLTARYPWSLLCPRHLPDNPEPPEGRLAWAAVATAQLHLQAAAGGAHLFERTDPRNGFAEFAAVYYYLYRVMGADQFAAQERLLPDLVQQMIPDAVRHVLVPYPIYTLEFAAHVLPTALACSRTPLSEWPPALHAILLDDTPRPAPQLDAANARTHLYHWLNIFGSNSPFGLRYDLSTYSDEPEYYHREDSKTLRIPAEHAMLTTTASRARARAVLPKLLPTNTTTELDDHTPFLSATQLQDAATLAIYMQATGGTLYDACARFRMGGLRPRSFRKAWWHLESRGTLGDYLDTAATIAARLLDTLSSDQRHGSRVVENLTA